MHPKPAVKGNSPEHGKEIAVLLLKNRNLLLYSPCLIIVVTRRTTAFPGEFPSAMEDLQIYEEIIRIKNSEQAATLVTLIRSTGSTPRKAGAKMLVHADGETRG